MKRWMMGFLFLLAVTMWAQSPFDGTWKADISSMKLVSDPDVRILQNGIYTCKSCATPYSIKADGTDQKIEGDPYQDAMSVKLVGDRTLERTWKKSGKIQGNDTEELSADGNVLAVTIHDLSNPNGKEVTVHFTQRRVAAGPQGSSPFSGSWMPDKLADISEAGTLVTYKMDGNILRMSAPTGQSYAAKLDGVEVPFVGDEAITTVSVKRLGPNTIEETLKIKDTVASVSKLTSDGHAMKVDAEDLLHKSRTTYTATKQ